MHFDWGASQFLTKQVQVGLVGYAYKDIGCDSGSGDRVGCFQSQVLGVGPQIGYIFPIGGMQGYLNLKAYGEFDGVGSAFRLECVADARDLAGGGGSARNDATHHHQIAAGRGWKSSATKFQAMIQFN